MIKRLISWLYERFGQEKPLTPETDIKARKFLLFARSASLEFRGAAYTRQPKPAYPLFEGKELNEDAKQHLDKVYETELSRVGFYDDWQPLTQKYKVGG